VSRPFKHFGALKNGHGFGIAVDDLDPLEEAQINNSLRDLKSNIRGIKFHPNFYPRNGKLINAWVVPAEQDAIEPMLDIIDRHEFKRSASAERLIANILAAAAERREAQAVNETMASAHDGPSVYVPGLVGELRPYQRAAVDWVVRNRKVYIGDEMGTGKTLSSLASVVVDGSLPVVVVCPASIKLGWHRQIQNFFPDLADKTFICSGRKTSTIPSGTKVVIVNYDILTAWVTKIQAFGYKAVIIDEAHFIKNAKSKRSQATVRLAQRAEMRIAMSGTPLVSRPLDLVAQLNAIGRFSDFTEGRGNWSFIQRYCRPQHNGYGWDLRGASNLFELNDKLRRYGILIRRRKEDVLIDLPPKERVSIPLEVTNRKEYEAVRQSIGVWVRQQVENDPEYIESADTLNRLERAALFERLMSEKVARAQAAIALTKLSALRQVTMRGKMKAAIEWIDDFLTSDEKLVIFCTHREAIDTLMGQYGDHAVRIIGGMGPDRKQAAIDAFANDPDVRLVIANIDAAAEGIDGWQHVCSNVAFLELTWTPTKHHQAEDRCHRSGQTNPVTCYYLMAQSTIDEYLASLIDSKRAVVSAVVDREKVEREDNILFDLLKRLTEGEF
jgi:SNF2 family DNA or RNA helicase